MSWWKRFLRAPHATPAPDSDHNAPEAPEATDGSTRQTVSLAARSAA